MWWQGLTLTGKLNGGLWSWNPAQNADCDSVAATGFSAFTVDTSAGPGFNTFCSSHLQLSGTLGRKVLIAGGTEGGVEVGTRKVAVFDPDSTSPWTASADLNAPRWYATSTRLSNGEIVVSSGSKYPLVLHRRVLIFGGSGSVDPDNPIASDTVYAANLSVTGDTVSWQRIIPFAPDGRPSARFGHAMVYDKTGYKRLHVPAPQLGTAQYGGILFGGKDVTGYSNEQWRLWISNTSPDTLEWRRVFASAVADSPSARAFHTMVIDATNRLLVYGGEVSGTVDPKPWRCPLPPSIYVNADVPAGTGAGSWSPQWVKLDQVSADYSMSHAAAIPLDKPIFARVADRYAADGLSRTAFPTSAAFLQHWYPFVFTLPVDGSILSCGPTFANEDTSYRQPYPTSPATWQAHPASPGSSKIGFTPGSGVMYEPGKIMVAGGPDILVHEGNSQSRSIDLSGATSNPTRVAAIDTMQFRRANHNLVILPNGHVMAVGGTKAAKDTTEAVKRPEIWRPDITSGGLRGDWYDSRNGETFAEHSLKRGYHSTAILLPDGRVMSAGGENNPLGARAEIYCPPYLFDSTGTLAARPAIAGVPKKSSGDPVGAINYSTSFNLCITGAGAGNRANLKACLIAPASTTHQFDMNQRYVPLTVTYCGEGDQISVAAPASGAIAPPGFYLLFVVNDRGVPSIAEWVVMGETPTVQPTCSATCGGGGGCPYVDVRTNSGWQTENTILGRSLEGELAYDAYRLKLTPDAAGGTIKLRVRENEQEVTTLDEARLLVVDYTPGFKVMGAGDGVVAGNWTPAWRVTTSRGEDITNRLTGGESGTGWQGSAGDTVLVVLDPPQAGMSAQAVQDEGGGTFGGDPKEQDLRYDPRDGAGGARAQRNAAPTLATDADWLRQTGIRIQRPDGQGGWTDVVHWYPRQFSDETYLPGLGRGTTRLIFVGNHRLTSLGRLSPAAGGAAVHALTPSSASHSRVGSVASEVAAGGSTTSLAPGDTVTLSFTVPTQEQGTERAYVLVTRGVYTTTASPARMQPGGRGLPTRFALLQNRPNPFGQSTTIQFELPTRSRVKLEIFDLFGRRIRTLTDTEWAAGYHQLDWDRRGENGQYVSAGVYSYRVTAGTFRDTRKMILLAK